MKTDELIKLLSSDGLPAERVQPSLVLGTAAGIFVAAVLFLGAIGFRTDILAALHSARFLFKFVVTLSLATTAILVALRLSRPEETLRSASLLSLAPILLMLAASAELYTLPSDQWMSALIGHNVRNCLTLIPLLSIGPLICLITALRHGAPSHPGWAGATAGLAASGIAATFYAANCNDDSPLFVATWYPIAILGVSAAGYLVGRQALKW